MTQPPAGWSTPGEPPPETPPPPPPPGHGPPPPGYAPPPGYGYPPYGQHAWGAPVVTPGVVPLRPLTLGELLDGAVKVIRRYPRPSLGISAIVASVTTLVNVLVVLATDYSGLVEDLRTRAEDGGDVGFSAGFGGGGLAESNGSGIVPGVVGWLAGLVLTGALVAVVGKAVLGQSTTFGDIWVQVRGRLLALVGLALLTGVLVAAPSVVAVLLAVLLAVAVDPVTLVVGVPLGIAGVLSSVYLGTRLSLAPAALVLEKCGIREALRRSGVLVKGDWWRVFGILLLIGLLTSVVTSVLVVPFAFVAGIQAIRDPQIGNVTVFLLVSQIGGGLATFLVSPFSAGAKALLYVDRRMRAEGLDLALQAAARG